MASKEDDARKEQLRIQALGAAISRRDWHAAEQAYNAIRDEFDGRKGKQCGDSIVSELCTDAFAKALNYIENTESELGIQLACGDALRALAPHLRTEPAKALEPDNG